MMGLEWGWKLERKEEGQGLGLSLNRTRCFQD